MAKEYDPIAWVPDSKFIQEQIDRRKRVLRRLELLLELAKKMESEKVSPDSEAR